MIHYGDITKIHGDQVPAVHVITGGSPCQDLSVAGKREGLKKKCHNYITCGFETDANSELERCPWCGSYLDLTRSGLFMEQIRIIKEMRNECERRLYDAGADYNRTDIKPRYMVWENVAGAFSSNAGEDFRVVLEETAKVADKDAYVPGLEGGKWSPCGCILGNGWSIAWRLHDAQYYGVPQRRKRICLLADFNGDSAGRILFELQRKTVKSDSEQTVLDSGKEPEPEIQSVSKGLSGDITQSGKEGERVTEDTERCAGEASTIAFEPGAASRVGGHMYDDDVAGTVRANAGDNQQAVVYGIGSYDSNAMKSDNPHSGIYKADTSRTLDLNGGNPSCNQGGMAVVQGADVYNGSLTGEVAATLTEACGGTNTSGAKVVCVENHPNDSRVKISEDGVCQTLSGRMGTGGGNVPMVMEQPYNATTGSFMRVGNSGIAETLAARDYKDPQIVCNSVVRRLTPMECERLQGYPDHWTDIGEWVDSKGKTHKDADSPRYKALGNSIALPFWEWMAERMMQYLPENPTMASLFSGIGGFELVFSRVGCKPVWASEVENFAIAVTKKRFGCRKRTGECF